MDDLRDELETATSSEESTQDTTQGTETFESAQDAGNQEQETLPSWQQHDNYKKGFWKTEDDVVKGYDYYDKKYKPFDTLIRQRGINDPKGLAEIFSKYDEYSNPESEINLVYQCIQNLYNHPTYGHEFRSWLTQVAEKEEIAKYGSRLPKEVKDQLQKVDQLEKWKQDFEYNEQVSKFNQKLEEESGKIQKLSEELGINYDEKEYLTYCLENNIGVNQIYDHFIAKNLDTIRGNVQNKTSQAVVKNISQNSKSAIPTSSKTVPTTSPVPANPKELKAAIAKELQG